MLRSLRTRLALLFAGTLLLATVIAGAASIRLYQSYNRDQTERDLRHQVVGAAQYFSSAVVGYGAHNHRAPTGLTVNQFQHICSCKLLWVGQVPPFPSASQLLQFAGSDTKLDWQNMKPGQTRTFQFVPPHDPHTYIGAAAPMTVDSLPMGAIVMAKPLADVNSAWTKVAGRVALGTAIGLLVAFILATLVARRITRPLKEIGAAADRVARGDLEVHVTGEDTADDELGQLAHRFQGMVNRLREVDELERNFLMRVTHELRTPVTAISGHVQAMNEGLVGPEDLDASLGAVGEEVRRIGRLVDDLLDLTRLEAHQFRLVREEVGLEALLEQAATSFRDRARANDVNFDALTAGAPTILSDGDRVLQIVSNLLDNAFRWTPRKGTVTLSYATANGTTAIHISDTGPGIPAADQDAVFHPFYSRRGEGGTGLGLSIGRELAHALGGRLTVDSEPGQGTTFTLSLPSSNVNGNGRVG
ncbi:MAG TPA: HAMP domain-containing sensor histidine kinase [Gaiellales bacterium]|nr:HAMP domain-containing sensor histidine kinase [Gaiellales bacterium]